MTGASASNAEPSSSFEEATIEPGRVLTVDLENPAHGGWVIARHGGRVIFVRGGLPGERGVRIAIDRPNSGAGRSKKKSPRFFTAAVLDISEPSPHRRDPVCPAAAAGAGCCDLDFVDAAGSASYKRAVVEDQIRRIAKVSLPGPVEVHSFEAFSGWRTRVRLAVTPDGAVGIRRRQSHDVVDIADALCAQWHPWITEAHGSNTEDLRTEIDSLRRRGKLRPNTELVVAADAAGRSIVELSGNLRRRPRETVLIGSGQVSRAVGDFTWSLPATAFWQAHVDAPEFYARWIAQHIPPSQDGDHSIGWDLYGGAGVFATTLTEKVHRVISVDSASAGTRAGRRTLVEAGLGSRVTFRDGRIPAALPTRQLGPGRQEQRPHAVVLDPPRTGAGRETIAALAAAGPSFVVHIGCDPATAARDLGFWVEHGYRIAAVTAVDSFGLTHHVELLAALIRESDIGE